MKRIKNVGAHLENLHLAGPFLQAGLRQVELLLQKRHLKSLPLKPLKVLLLPAVKKFLNTSNWMSKREHTRKHPRDNTTLWRSAGSSKYTLKKTNYG